MKKLHIKNFYLPLCLKNNDIFARQRTGSWQTTGANFKRSLKQAITLSIYRRSDMNEKQ